ncbi:MAG: 16S rRNA (cytidine(1402)-2'-O)-methyltransferase [Bacillota bacterium]
MQGTLYLCGTPIGNMDDMTARVISVLQTVDLIAAEDTRTSGKLLNHHDIHTKMTSYHEHNKHGKTEVLIKQLLEGKQIALISDAGMPGISDPGEELVRACHEHGIVVTAVPTASAFVVALVLSGFSTRRFVFEGFLPTEKKEKRELLAMLEKEHRTMIFYEAPHRLLETLREFAEVLGGDRRVAVARELTKKFEEVRRDTFSGQITHFEETPPRGEFVLVIEGYSLEEQKRERQEAFSEMSIVEHMALYKEETLSEKDLMKKVAKERGVSKSVIYKAVQEAKKES